MARHHRCNEIATRQAAEQLAKRPVGASEIVSQVGPYGADSPVGEAEHDKPH